MVMIEERQDYLSNVISTLTTEHLVRKGCEAYLAFVFDSGSEKPSVIDIQTVKDFLDIFPDELLITLEKNQNWGLKIEKLARKLQREAIRDELRQLRSSLKENQQDHEDYKEQEGLIVFKGRIVVPNEIAFRTLLMREFLDSKTGGHAGINRTYQRIAAYFFWLPKSYRKETVLVFVGPLSKYAHFSSLPKKFDSKIVARVLVQGVVKLHGILKSLVSDRHRVFTSDIWTKMARLQGTELCMSSAYYPQTDGQTEALNRCLEMYLRVWPMKIKVNRNNTCLGQNTGITQHIKAQQA
ncbi:uncharacterized protein [Gossypium hirsutum]|uniref:Integrase catalytic domain-containing protein n=1 Tax=Gossypium hirsutum TaxID=3635 RepID=A0A1U8N7K4_GOSHI|nr:uncharacterized protein LOC107945524 [Gossypium hirsutum]